MTEKILHLETIDPIDLLGVNNSRLDIFKKAFPKIQIVARGHEVKIMGEEQGITDFEEKFSKPYISSINSIDYRMMTCY
jgi:phosphate starvation-inducible PhoH-like protein